MPVLKLSGRTVYASCKSHEEKHQQLHRNVTQQYEGLRYCIITLHHKFHLSYMVPHYVTLIDVKMLISNILSELIFSPNFLHANCIHMVPYYI